MLRPLPTFFVVFVWPGQLGVKNSLNYPSEVTLVAAESEVAEQIDAPQAARFKKDAKLAESKSEEANTKPNEDPSEQEESD